MRVKCLAQEHNTMSRLGLEPGPLALESSTLTRRLEGLVFINKFKLLKVFAICETVDHSSDIQQTLPLTKIKASNRSCFIEFIHY